MNPLLYYLLQVMVASGILYAYYHFALRNKKFHQYNRFYLLAATVISLLVPFLNIPVYFTQSETDSSFVLQTLTVISAADTEDSPVVVVAKKIPANWFTRENLCWLFYILIAASILLRIIFSFIKIRKIIKNNPVEQLNNIHFVNTTEPGTPFSFFRWLFWNKNIALQSEKGEQIFRHELFHIEQKHSWDIIYLELLTLISWINPFFHLIKKEVKAIHEFLADQFAITENKKWEYAELLLMQALGTQQHLVNPFFHNQIKRRIAMINTSKKPSYQYIRKLMVLPVAGIVLGLFAFSYKEKQQKSALQDSKVFEENLNRAFFSDTSKPEVQAKTINRTTKLLSVDSMNMDGQNQSKGFLKEPGVTLKEIKINEKKVERIDSLKVHISPKTMNYWDTMRSKPLVIIDGKRYPITDFNSLDPNIIESINVIKDQSAILKYGDDGRNGAIEIFTKKDKVNKLQEIDPDNKIFTQVETDPSFPGGSSAWVRYLERSTDPSVPVRKKAPEGSYTVVIQFIVDKEGKISNVTALTNHGFGMEEEAIRSISKGPDWIPAIQNGRQVTVYKKQPITFIVGNGQKNFPSHVIATGNELKEVVLVGYTDNKILAKVEPEPSFPGGQNAFDMYIAANQKKYKSPVTNPGLAGKLGIMYTSFVVKFMVDIDGSVSDITLPGYDKVGFGNDAIDLIKKGPKWIPAMQNGKPVKAYKNQTVRFAVTEEDKPKKNNSTPAITMIDLHTSSVYQLLQLKEGTEIKSFAFSVDLPNNDIVELPNQGNQFNASITKLIKSITPGRTIVIENIRTMENGKEKREVAKSYTVTN